VGPVSSTGEDRLGFILIFFELIKKVDSKAQHVLMKKLHELVSASTRVALARNTMSL
jgi:hypothetical protein